MPVKCKATIVDMNPNKADKPHARRSSGKEMISFNLNAIDLWKSIPQYLKELNVNTFSLRVKHYLIIVRAKL